MVDEEIAVCLKSKAQDLLCVFDKHDFFFAL